MNAVRTVPLCVAPDHPAMPGHFPGNPLVPGVVVLERVAAAWKAWRGAEVGKLDAKFVQPLLPGEDATITLHAGDARVRFEVKHADGRTIARGTFAAAETRA